MAHTVRIVRAPSKSQVVSFPVYQISGLPSSSSGSTSSVPFSFCNSESCHESTRSWSSSSVSSGGWIVMVCCQSPVSPCSSSTAWISSSTGSVRLSFLMVPSTFRYSQEPAYHWRCTPVSGSEDGINTLPLICWRSGLVFRNNSSSRSLVCPSLSCTCSSENCCSLRRISKGYVFSPIRTSSSSSLLPVPCSGRGNRWIGWCPHKL